ncbi:glycosyltransferase family 2 protein [Paenarthrobacter sp. Z7-10]|nr:glycosyltransferase family 2 protein [Paenarthrobacter sp. Z7-10]
MSGLPPEASYILPLRWSTDEGLSELVSYLDRLTGWIDVILVDGSAEPLFQAHAKAFTRAVRHVRPQVRAGANGKVAAVMTGVALAQTELLVLADDDVRYEGAPLRRVLSLLSDAEVVRPQNYFLTLPWHARWDTARSLINRAFSADFPGTLGVRRSALVATDGYDGDVLFENLELLRTIRAAGGRELRANDVFVGRVPPSARHFLHQRIRQAYDDFAQPRRLVFELSLLPAFLTAGYQAVRRHRPWWALILLTAACTVAEAGRRKNAGRQVFSPSAALWAPVWLVERSVCIWAAVVLRGTGGVSYSGSRLSLAAHSSKQLHAQHAGKIRSAQRREHP